MAKYYLNKISASVYSINAGTTRVGHVIFKDAKFNAKITRGEHTVTAVAYTAREAFREVVAGQNRIAICGENDAAKAAATLQRQNDELARNVAAKNKLLEGTGLRYVTRRRRVTI